MKKQIKGVIFLVIFGGGLLFWGTAASMPNILPSDQELTVTGTPADNFPDSQREQFCETGDAKSNQFIQEYKIPTECTQPLGIVTDPQGNVWFAQTNTGNIAKFYPENETFVEYENPTWPAKGRSMMWGVDYSPDGSIWFTEEVFDSIWKFSIQDEQYSRIVFPTETDALPQRLKIQGSQIVVNDFIGNKLTFWDPIKIGRDTAHFSVPSPLPDAQTGDFAVDSNNDIWYTNWVYQQGGYLIKFDQDDYRASSINLNIDSLPLDYYITGYRLPIDATTPNGIIVGPQGKIWIVDTSSSFFFSFDPLSEQFTKYITSDPHISSYGNATGVIKLPVSRPYWIEINDFGKLVFNEHTANSIGVFDPIQQTLVEYLVPSKNPNWADCEELDDCGVAQIFGFTLHENKVWFTQWVENNIGVLDTSVTLPFSIHTDTQTITLADGDIIEFDVTVVSHSTNVIDMSFVSSDTSQFSDLVVESDVSEFQIDSDESRTIRVTVTASNSSSSADYKILIGAQTEDITISQYITATIT